MGISHLKYISIHTSHISSAPQPHVTGGCYTEQHKTPTAQSIGVTWELVTNRLSSPSADPLIQNLHFNKTPGDLHAHSFEKNGSSSA